jgi:hypothetical protein
MSKEKRSKRLGRGPVCRLQVPACTAGRAPLPTQLGPPMILLNVATHANLTFPLLHIRGFCVSVLVCIEH